MQHGKSDRIGKSEKRSASEKAKPRAKLFPQRSLHFPVDFFQVWLRNRETNVPSPGHAEKLSGGPCGDNFGPGEKLCRLMARTPPRYAARPRHATDDGDGNVS